MMKIAAIILGVFCSFFSLQAVEIQRLTEALRGVDASTVVVLDIDDTLIHPVQMVGSTDWGHHVTGQLIAAGMDREEAFWLSTDRLMAVNRLIDVAVVEAETPALIRDLQSRGIVVLACTARPGSFAEATHRQLASVGIDLPSTAPALDDFSIPGGARPPAYSRGIIYSYGTSKGEALAGFLQIAGVTPSHLVFVDDSWKHVQAVQRAMDGLGIPCTVYRYAGADVMRSSFDPEVADLQWEMAGKILSDDQARWLLKLAA
jgi:hypothetical protein